MNPTVFRSPLGAAPATLCCCTCAHHGLHWWEIRCTKCESLEQEEWHEHGGDRTGFRREPRLRQSRLRRDLHGVRDETHEDVLHASAGHGAKMVRVPRPVHGRTGRHAGRERELHSERRLHGRSVRELQDEVECAELGHLIGTELLKPYMHGYFVHQKLYRRAIEVSEPFAYEKYRKEKAREKVEAERQNRISKGRRRGRRRWR
ncbi:Nucleolar protein 10/Enp2 [Gracilaria domingensis]|nr:Nucleolar protein 10/Enp2 [Gracilaria domingensis]